MSLIAEFTIPPEAIPGGKTLRNLPNTRIELDRIVPTNEGVFPFLWVFGVEADEFVAHAVEESEIVDIDVIAQVTDGALLQVEWSIGADVIDAITEMDASIMEGTGTAEEWYFRVRAEDRAGFTQFREIFTRRDVSIQLNRLYNLADLLNQEHHSLTPEQRETLIAAFQYGYFDEPRQITQRELGELFDVSGRAISKRLRRGIRNLVASAIVPGASRTDDTI